MENSRTPPCPKCQGSNVKNIKGHDSSGHHAHGAMHMAKSLAGAGPIGQLLAAAGGYVASKLIHENSHSWECQSCQHKF